MGVCGWLVPCVAMLECRVVMCQDGQGQEVTGTEWRDLGKVPKF
jgi:hypothetical protein